MQPLSKEEQEIYDKAKYCHICKKVFDKKKNQLKVRDHDHNTGKVRGAAHSICNLKYATEKDISVFLHNGTNYDFNLLVNEFAKEYKGYISCIPLNTDKYMSSSIQIKKEVIEPQEDQKKKLITQSLRFIDTARHMNRGLSALVDNLSELTIRRCEDVKNKDNGKKS